MRRAKDGRLIDISLTVSPVGDSTGRIIGASKIARDIGERRRIEDERDALLVRAQEARAKAEALTMCAPRSTRRGGGRSRNLLINLHLAKPVDSSELRLSVASLAGRVE